jgi:hypothetical protein
VNADACCTDINIKFTTHKCDERKKLRKKEIKKKERKKERKTERQKRTYY